MIERFTKKRNAIIKRITTVILSLMVAVTAVIPCIPSILVYASEIEWEKVGETVTNDELKDLSWKVIDAVVGIPSSYLVNRKYYNSSDNTVPATPSVNNITKNYHYGVNNNTTNNYSVVKYNNSSSSTTTNYKYSIYNPVTKTYNTTNNVYYNQQYNTYNYNTYNTVNNYTTNYYIQDNRTFVSYYIVEEDNSTGEIFETYYEIYFQLPDGRNSYNLTKEDIWGTTFIYDYSKYESVKEDDGTTLGLWHLDGDTKDSSYYGNSAGLSYTSEFKDAKFEGGKYFSNNLNDFLELKLDKATLPNSYTLEWVQYISDNDFKQFDLEEYPLPIPMSSNVEWKYGYIVSSRAC